jgi:ABC-type Fe3+ transport system permease subunit
MKLSNQITAIGLVLVPLLSEAHPGHSIDQSHSLAGLVFVAAAIVAIKHAYVTAKTRTARRGRHGRDA